MPNGLYAEDGSYRTTETSAESLLTSIGSPSDTAWNGTDPEASLISVMKGVYALLNV